MVNVVIVGQGDRRNVAQQLPIVPPEHEPLAQIVERRHVKGRALDAESADRLVDLVAGENRQVWRDAETCFTTSV